MDTLLVKAKFENNLLEQVTFNKVNLAGTIFKQTRFKIHVNFIDLSLVNFYDSINLTSLKIKQSVIT